MAIPVSTVPAVLNYLITQINAQVNDNTVQVWYGEPGAYTRKI
jgi:hypothetical protein